MTLIRQPFRLLGLWATTSQHQARRNAMIASTRLAQRRAELREVDEYLAALTAPTHSDRGDREQPTPAVHG